MEKERKRQRDRAALARGEKIEDDADDRGSPYGTDDEGMKGGILIPLAPFGIPKYDNGERFDLKVWRMWLCCLDGVLFCKQLPMHGFLLH
jgi:hypothetical protein